MTKYFNETKASDEKLIHSAYISLWVLIPLVVKITAISVLINFLIKTSIGSIKVLSIVPLLGDMKLSSLIIILAAGWYSIMSIRVLIFIFATEVNITNKRIILKRGLILRNVQEIRTDKVEGSRISQGVIDRLIGIGTLHVQGTGGITLTARHIKNPTNTKRILLEHSED